MGASKTSVRLKDFASELLSEFPWQINIKDWTGRTYSLGLGKKHWRNGPLNIHFKTEAAGKDLLSLNALRFLERFVEGDVDMEGNIYLLPLINKYNKFFLSLRRLFSMLLRNKAFLFQNMSRSTANVKSHYDIPQEALNIYLDKTYMSYSCGMFENPGHLDANELVRAGNGREDNFDSLEKSQWRKFKDAVDFISPDKGETLLDIGCGYGGQLVVALENQPFGKVVGWTHSRNQVVEGRKLLSNFDKKSWELNEGDYREDNKVYDHIASTGMVSHVGPRGLGPYVKNVRKRIKEGGRYLHHSLMIPYLEKPLDAGVGTVFNKKYVWPGFHWFTLGEHIKALQENGFEVTKLVNLSPHYEKTTASWYERMMANKDTMIKNLGEPTFRAWQIYLAGCSATFGIKKIHVYRIYCEAV
ncbi:class I SAM-dependent methyltransferase [Candidatus Woesearchaeota archaeon]|nr:class I SAM-dependent methyltransferase [Candidatus Woesearchaeota archaeon]